MDNDDSNNKNADKRLSMGKVFNRQSRLWFGLCITFIYLLLAIFGPAVAPYTPDYIDEGYGLPDWQDPLPANFLEPFPGTYLTAEHWLGTDFFGRDILSQLLYGARTSLMVVSISAVFVAVICFYLCPHCARICHWVASSRLFGLPTALSNVIYGLIVYMIFVILKELISLPWRTDPWHFSLSVVNMLIVLVPMVVVGLSIRYPWPPSESFNDAFTFRRIVPYAMLIAIPIGLYVYITEIPRSHPGIFLSGGGSSSVRFAATTKGFASAEAYAITSILITILIAGFVALASAMPDPFADGPATVSKNNQI